jgi:hypothetical protein
MKKMFRQGLAVGLALLLLSFSPLAPAQEDDVFARIQDQTFLFLSGAGGWSTELVIAPDGSFTGYFHDSDLGDTGEGYPEGTLYESRFTGAFEFVEQVDLSTWSLRLASLETAEAEGSLRFEDGRRIITGEAYGIAGGEGFLLFAPGKLSDELPENFIEWVRPALGLEEMPGTLPFWGLYSVQQEASFYSSRKDNAFALIEGQTFLFQNGFEDWYTELVIASGGSFTGYFLYPDPGFTGEGFPEGTMYESRFMGTFEIMEQIDPFTWSLCLASLETAEKEGALRFEDGWRFMTIEAFGIAGGEYFLLYAPGKPGDELPENYIEWVSQAMGFEEMPSALPFWGLYSIRQEASFYSSAEE